MRGGGARRGWRPITMAAGALLAATACGGPQSALDPAGPAAESIAAIWWWMLAGAAVVWALVLGLLARALLRGGDSRALARPQRLIVAGGLLLPTVVLAALLVYGSVHSQRITGSGGDVALVVAVDARQWQWTFRYLDDDAGATRATTIDALVLPRGRMVEFQVRSQDVIHSFWIPRLGGKVDAIPGRVNRLRLRADRAGAMRGQCAEFCGLEHAHMAFDVHVLEPGAWDAWLRAQQAAADRTAGAP